MNKGPKFNNIKRKFVYRNSMGYDEVINSLQDKTSPIITNVTDNIYYFSFIVWSMNDYLSNTSVEQRTSSNMDNYFKLQNFFFTTSFLLNNIDLTGASGSQYIQDYVKKNESDTFIYDENYIDTLQTTMGYYKPGLDPLFLIKSETLEGEQLPCPQVTSYGKELAEVFENIIKDTEYFKNYRQSDTVPKNVLKELGNKVNIYMKGMDSLQRKMEEVLFNNKYNKDNLISVTLNKDFLIYTKNKYNCDIRKDIRKIEFDYYSPRSLNYKIPRELERTAKEWEIVMGRQYFTLGLNMIWKHMLNILNKPMTEEQWMNNAKEEIIKDLDNEITLDKLRLNCNYSYEEREEMIKAGVKIIQSNLLVDGLKLILSIYNRFENRDDLGKEYEEMFGIKDDFDTIPLVLFFENIKNYKNNKAIDYLEMLMKKLIRQNKIIGYKKLKRGKNAYYYEYSNGYYFKIANFEYDYSGNRLINVIRALEDLNMLGDCNNE